MDDHARIDIANAGEVETETWYSDEGVNKSSIADKECIDGSVHLPVRPLGEVTDNAGDLRGCDTVGVRTKR